MRLCWFVIGWLFCLAAAQDYYAILGVAKDASEKDIKSAYRQMSKKWHPDKNAGDDEAHHKFIEIGEAYEVLSDSEKRATYDRFGADALKNGGGGGGGHPGGFGGGGFHDPFDLFNQMFGDSHPGGQNVRKGSNLIVKDSVTLNGFYHGFYANLTLDLNDDCEHCHGSGAEDNQFATCETCQGRGVIIQVIQMGFMTQQIQQVCGACQGKGKTIKHVCKICRGARVVKTPKTFEISVPAGAQRNYNVVKSGQAEKVPDMQSGDLVFVFEENSHENLGYRRRGDHLYRTEVLHWKEALLGGWERRIAFFDDQKQVVVKRDKNVVTAPGEIERVPNLGMPKLNSKGKSTNAYGDLFIEYVIVSPKEFPSGKGSPEIIRDEL